MNAVAAMPLPRLVRIYAADAGYEFLRLLRAPGASVPMLAFPAMFYLLFGVMFGHHGVQQATYVLGSMAAFGVMAPGLFGFGVVVAIERERGLLALKRALPVPPGAYLAAKMVMAMLFAALIFVILAVLAAVIGGVRLAPTQWLALALVMVLGVLPFCAIGLLVGTWVSAQAAPAIANLIYLPMSFLSGLWVPLAAMPHVLQQLAPLWPAWYLGRLSLRAVGMAHAPLGPPIAALLLFTAVFFVLAVRRLRRAG
ncbi:ABC transporter permease [Metallibacterium sp.]|jgi:ABC-2 type transport system permease protein|uniref:ABC transporter permease n=1 Tax=Metallibacterium sp. TaxID=2940281 RepID=UPI00262B25CC|nr:ABC transporter permease [Metallibacterium sp.]